MDAETLQTSIHIKGLHDEVISIGGDKIALYRSHLVTLYKIYERIKHEEETANLLIAQATGSGKTFVQALWLLCLHLADIKGFFGVPGKLEHQFREDLKRLLPDSFVDNNIGRLPDAENIDTQAEFLGQPHNIVVGDSEQLLDNHFSSLMSYQDVVLSFDEQHLLMQVERRRLRLIRLSNQFLSCFLTATPNEETYQLCHQDPVATMSNKQKAAAKHGKISKIIAIHAQSSQDKNKYTKGFFKRFARKFNLALSDAIQQQPTSAAKQILEDLPFLTREINGKPTHAVSQKILFIVDDTDSLINLCYRLSNAPTSEEPFIREVYDHGNLYSREAISQVLGISDVDAKLCQAKKDHQSAQFQNQQDQDLRNQDISYLLKKALYHHMIDFVLADAMGLNIMALNQYRQNNPDAYFLHMCLILGLQDKENLTPEQQNLLDRTNLTNIEQITRDNIYYENLLKDKIGESGAVNVSKVLAHLFKTLSVYFKETAPDKQKICLINNASETHTFIQNRIKNNNIFQEYASKHLILCVMDDMHNQDLSLTPNEQGKPRPFWGLKQDEYMLYDTNGFKSAKAKSRALKPIEMLNPEALENRFTPNYDDQLTEAQADNYFKLGLVGAYVSNRKTEGFNDLNLHTVVNVCNDGGQRANGPDKLLQGLGRNRGLDETIEPLFIHALGHKQRNYFDFQHLDKDDYYVDYFKSMHAFKKEYLRLLAVALARNIIAEYHNNADAQGLLDGKKYRKIILTMIKEDLREINSHNHHEIKISRKELAFVLKHAAKHLDTHLQHLAKPSKLSTTIVVLASIITFISTIYTKFAQLKPKYSLKRAAKKSEKPLDKIYDKIIRYSSVKQFISMRFISLEITAMLTQEQRAIKEIITQNAQIYLQDSLYKKAQTHIDNTIKPILLKFIHQEYYEYAKTALDNETDIVSFLYKNKHLIQQLRDEHITEDETKKCIIALFQQMELTRHIEEKDVVCVRHLEQSSQLSAETKSYIAQQSSPFFIQLVQDKMRPYLIADEQAKLDEQLNNPIAVREFIHTMLNQQAQPSNAAFSEENVLALFCAKMNIKNPTNEAQKFKLAIDDLEQEISRSSFKALNVDTQNNILNLFKHNLLAGMLNLCPYPERKKLVEQIKDEAIKDFLSTQFHELERRKAQQEPVETTANWILSTLTNQTVTSAQNPEEIKEKTVCEMQDLIKKSQKISFNNAKHILQAAGQSVFGWARKTDVNLEDVKIHYIKKKIKEDAFLHLISRLFPYEQYLGLVEKIRNPREGDKATTAIAKVLLDTDDSALDLKIFTQNIAQAADIKLDFIEDTVSDGTLKLEEIMAKVKSLPGNYLNNEMIAKVPDDYLKTQFIPYLARHIRNGDRRALFIEHCQNLNGRQLLNFLVVKQDDINKIEQYVNSSSDNNPQTSLLELLNTLNCLCANERQEFNQNDLHSLDSFEKQSDVFRVEMEIEVYNHYLLSAQFMEKVQLGYNEEDFKKISEKLIDDHQIRRNLAEQLQLQHAQQANFPEIIKAFFAQHFEVQDLESRLTDADAFFKTLEPQDNNYLEHLNKPELNELIKQRVINKLNHPIIKKQFSVVIDLLDEGELADLIDVIYDSSSTGSGMAQDLKKFNAYLQQGQNEEIVKEFIDDNIHNFENQRLSMIFKVFNDLQQEIIANHCFFNLHDEKGLVPENEQRQESKLSPRISIKLRGIKGKLADFACQTSYMRGIQNSFSATNCLHKLNHINEITSLNRVKNNILWPIHHKINRFRIRNWLSQKSDATVKALKRIFVWHQHDTNPIEAKEQEQDHQKIEKFSYHIMALNQLDLMTASQDDAPLEAVDTLLSPKKKRSLSFFDAENSSVHEDSQAFLSPNVAREQSVDIREYIASV